MNSHIHFRSTFRFIRAAASVARSAWRLSIVALAFGCGLYVALTAGTAPANPIDGSVVAGAATINSAGNTLNVMQSTDRAVINWGGFSIAPGEITSFQMPNSSSAVLNRVIGGDPSSILGTLQANGNVFLINPNGILVGQGAQINVGGFVASTLDVGNQMFMQGGDLTFSGDSTRSIVNQGSYGPWRATST